MRVLLTGASGAIGRHVLPMLLAQSHQVTVATRPGSRRASRSPAPGMAPTPLDIFDGAAAARLMRGHDAVINLATRVPTGPVRPFLPGAWAETDRIRRDASRILTRAAHDAGVPRFVQESFAPIYADAGGQWIDETSAVRPARYNRTVLDAERAVEELRRPDGGIGVVLRFAFFYGEDDAYTRTIMETVRRGWMPYLGRPDAYVPLIRHEDAAAAVVAALSVPAGVYNVVDDEPFTRRELGGVIARALCVKAPRMLPAWLAKLGGPVAETIARSLRISNRKLRDAAGWAPRYPSAREGWRLTVV
jgi:nucleoside-diphosphate-sugar epimerase